MNRKFEDALNFIASDLLTCETEEELLKKRISYKAQIDRMYDECVKLLANKEKKQAKKERTIGNSLYRICQKDNGEFYIMETYNDGSCLATGRGYYAQDYTLVLKSLNLLTKEKEVIEPGWKVTVKDEEKTPVLDRVQGTSLVNHLCDFVRCMNCGSIMLVNHDYKTCPECEEKNTFEPAEELCMRIWRNDAPRTLSNLGYVLCDIE